jgi:glycosyltransferase involved in cell wall biosynthesis
MIKKYLVSTVVSAFNEENTIQEVVGPLLYCPLVNEVIIVNDGSTDKTRLNLECFLSMPKVKYIEFKKNRGKSYAMIAGVEASEGEIIVFVDADLQGLESQHIEQMILPLTVGKADMVIGHPTENRLDEKLNPLQMLSGERALFKRDIIHILENLRTSKYGIESLINIYYKSEGKKIIYTYLWGVYHLIKFRKESINISLKNYAVEIKHISRTLVENRLLVYAALKQAVVTR